jgi:periplasmic protein TonB
MFSDSLLDTSWGSGSHRIWTTLTSLTLQALAVAVLLILPLLCTQGLPKLTLLEKLPLPAPPPAPPSPTPTTRTSTASGSNLSENQTVLMPPAIPHGIADIHEDVPPPPIPLGREGVAHGTGDRRSANTVLGSTFLDSVAPPPPLPRPTPRPVRPSSVMEANLVHRVQPAYPPLARAARIQGPVVLQAVISKSGTIENLQVLNGHPMLVRSALDAVRQWRYRPYFLNGEPVEVETQITVNFILSGG